jgi:hypothetical protein
MAVLLLLVNILLFSLQELEELSAQTHHRQDLGHGQGDSAGD